MPLNTETTKNINQPQEEMSEYTSTYPNSTANTSVSNSDIKRALKTDVNALQERKNRSNKAALLQKAKNSGANAARYGRDCPTEEELRAKKYTPEQIEAYFNAYNVNTGSSEEQQIRKAKSAGATSGYSICQRPTEAELQQKYNYSPDQIKAFLKAHDALKKRQMLKANDDPSTDAMDLKRAAARGSSSALRGYNRPTEAELQKRNQYSPAQIKAYLEAYDKKAGSPEEQQIRKAKDAGANAARQTSTPPTKKELQEGKRKYTSEQAEAYLKAYDEAKTRKSLKRKTQQNNILLDEFSSSKETDFTKNEKIQKTYENQSIDFDTSFYGDLLSLLQEDNTNLTLEEKESSINNLQNSNLNDINLYEGSFLDSLFNEQGTYLSDIYLGPSFKDEAASLAQTETNLSYSNEHPIDDNQNIHMCMPPIPDNLILQQYSDINTFHIETRSFTNSDKNNFNNPSEPTEITVQEHHGIINNAQCGVTAVSSSNNIHHAFTSFRKKTDSNFLGKKGLIASDDSQTSLLEKKTSFIS